MLTTDLQMLLAGIVIANGGEIRVPESALRDVEPLKTTLVMYHDMKSCHMVVKVLHDKTSEGEEDGRNEHP